jgi:Fur family peroxide stress response transcriptional regulator
VKEKGGLVMAVRKYSRQRQSIKEYLMTQTTHPTADDVYRNVKEIYPNISLGTVYRNLSLLTELGEIQKLSGLDGADHYDGRIIPHCHFICRKCGRVEDLDIHMDQTLLAKAEASGIGKITGYSANFYGICKACMQNPS